MTMSKDKPRKAPPMPDPAVLHKIAVDAMVNFRDGQTTELESALGMLYMGHAFGWRVIYITHSISTVRKYEKILGIVAKDAFPERTAHSDRVSGYRAAEKASNFWKAVKGEMPADGIRDKTVATN